MMDPPPESRSPCGSPREVSDNTMEVLKEFLQHMTRTIELLCTRYSTALNDSESLISSSIVMPSIGEVPGTRLCGELSNLQPASNINDDNFGQMQSWSSQGASAEEKMQGGRSHTSEEKCVNSAEAVVHGAALHANSRSFDRKNEDALKAFLEDMKETIQSWSVRHKLLVQGKSVPIREGADVVDVVRTARTTEAICCPPHPTDSNVRDIDLLDLVSDDVSFPGDKDQDVAVTELSGQPSPAEDCEMPRSDNVSEGCTAKTETACFVQPEDGEERWNSSLSQAEQGETDAVTLPSAKGAKETGCEPPQHNHKAHRQDVADVQEQVKEMKTGLESTSLMHLEVGPAQSKSHVDNGEMDVDITSRNDSGEVDNLFTAKVGQAEPENRSRDEMPKNLPAEAAMPPNDNHAVHQVAIRPHCRTVDVVDSPDWLPKGWITELKTRTNGQSAGSKDKYFYDPVSKRRFRSKKEVFCFLETGKLGRYKKRPKVPSVGKLPGPELPSAGQANDSCQPRNVIGSETSGLASSSMSHQNNSSTSGPSTITTVPAPVGLFSNLFMPYRPGQPSEWLVYESLASLPLPVFDHFRYAEYNLSKSMGNRPPLTRPWFSNNSDFSWRPFVDKSDLGQSVDKSKGGQTFEFSEGDAPILESLPRKSKKVSKQTSTT